MMAKLNIWVRDRNCEIIKKRAHLHVYNCCRQTPAIEPFWFSGGHIEVNVPPGCYLVIAGVIGGNIYTDISMAIVRCGDDACVNLILNDYQRRTPFPQVEASKAAVPALIQRECPVRIAVPFIVNAARAGIGREEIWKSLDVLLKAANIDRDEVVRGIDLEIREIESDLEKYPPKNESERKEIQEHLSLLKENLSDRKH